MMRLFGSVPLGSCPAAAMIAATTPTTTSSATSAFGAVRRGFGSTKALKNGCVSHAPTLAHRLQSET